MKKYLATIFIITMVGFFSCEEADPCESNPQLCGQEQFQEQFQEDLLKIETFVDANNLNPIEDESGLHYYANNPGLTDSVNAGQFVSVDYVGRLLDGTVFDTSVDSVAREAGIFSENNTYNPISFQLGIGRVIPGWDLGLTFFEEGGTGYLIIPSYLAYGKEARGSIPANSVLYFEINLIDVRY